jgi:hypothetical protein
VELVGTCFSLGRCLNRWNYVELSNGPWLPGWVAKFVFLEFGNKIVSHWVKNMVVQCYTYTSSQWALAANEMLFQKAVISCQVPMVQSYLGWFEDIWSMSQAGNSMFWHCFDRFWHHPQMVVGIVKEVREWYHYDLHPDWHTTRRW